MIVLPVRVEIMISVYHNIVRGRDTIKILALIAEIIPDWFKIFN